MVEAARAAARAKTYLGAPYRRLAALRGAKRAALAVAHTIVVIAYHLLVRGESYRDLGSNYFDERDATPYSVALCAGLRISASTSLCDQPKSQHSSVFSHRGTPAKRGEGTPCALTRAPVGQ